MGDCTSSMTQSEDRSPHNPAKPGRSDVQRKHNDPRFPNPNAMRHNQQPVHHQRHKDSDDNRSSRVEPNYRHQKSPIPIGNESPSVSPRPQQVNEGASKDRSPAHLRRLNRHQDVANSAGNLLRRREENANNQTIEEGTLSFVILVNQ